MSQTLETEYYGETELRWYQIAARNEVAELLSEGVKRICMVLPTGAGKTITVAASMSYDAIRNALGVTCDRKVRVLFAAHKHRLLTQADQAFIDSDHVDIITHSYFSPLPEKEFQKGIDVIVLDEAHHEACASFQFHLERLGDFPIIGLTATPDRADGMVIKFQSIVNPISRERAVEEGYLAETYLNTVVDSTDKNKVEITTAILDEYIDQFGQTLMFFRTKQEARDVNAYLNQKGYKSVALVSNGRQAVEDALNAFSDGEIQFITNCAVISEGVDVKGCTTIFLGRAVNSYPLLNQIIGRAARPDSDCNVWELINALSGKNLDTTVVTGTPETHRLIFERGGKWNESKFDYTGNQGQIFGKEKVAYH